jgi:hypothetical protein
MTSTSSIRITYLPVRARCEPVLLILADSGTQFEYEEIPITRWGEMKKTGQVTPKTFPYSGLPVLHVTDKTSESGGEFLLGETPAILSYLEEILAPPGAMVSLMCELVTVAALRVNLAAVQRLPASNPCTHANDHRSISVLH